jgi:hypothetical protein
MKTPKFLTERTGATIWLSTISGSDGSWCCRLVDATQWTSVLSALNCNRFDCIHSATTLTQPVTELLTYTAAFCIGASRCYACDCYNESLYVDPSWARPLWSAYDEFCPWGVPRDVINWVEFGFHWWSSFGSVVSPIRPTATDPFLRHLYIYILSLIEHKVQNSKTVIVKLQCSTEL